MDGCCTGSHHTPASAQRTETKLTDGWEFRRDGLESDKTWKAVTIPHDWAIYGRSP